MKSRQTFRLGVGRLTLMLALVLGCSIAPASAQSSPEEATPFRSEWVVLGGGGISMGRGERADREQAISAIEWGRVISGEHGPGILRGRLEMLVEITPLFLAFQSDRAEGAGFSPLMLRWNLRERGRIHPFIEIAGGIVATNQDVPEGTTRLNFLTHAGLGLHLRMAERLGLLVGYRFQHLSNGTTAARNPGFNSNVGYLGLAYRR